MCLDWTGKQTADKVLRMFLPSTKGGIKEAYLSVLGKVEYLWCRR